MIQRAHFAFLCIGHFFDHMFMLVFATVAALTLTHEWGLSYSDLIPYATPGFIAFGVCSVPAGWIADKWSRNGMMIVFYIGIGLSSIFTALAETPVQIGVGLFFIGLFAAIYHPVGLALVVQGRVNTGVPLAVNGVFGNMGVACAALITGYLIDHAGWGSAFVWPGIISIAMGIAFATLLAIGKDAGLKEIQRGVGPKKPADALLTDRKLLARAFVIILFTTAFGGLIFQSTTFALPKVFSERLAELGMSATQVGGYAFIVFAIAAIGQLVVGYFLDHFALRTVFMIVAVLQAVFFFVMPGLLGWGALIVAVGFMLVVFGQIPINDVLVSRITQSAWRSRVYALRYFVAFSVMASSVPFIAWIHFHWGFDRLFNVLSGAAALVFTLVVMLPKALTGKRR